jgi:hypothetical protein
VLLELLCQLLKQRSSHFRSDSGLQNGDQSTINHCESEHLGSTNTLNAVINQEVREGLVYGCSRKVDPSEVTNVLQSNRERTVSTVKSKQILNGLRDGKQITLTKTIDKTTKFLPHLRNLRIFSRL